MSFHDVTQAVQQLAGSGRGQQAIRDLSAFFDNGGCSLDSMNQRAVCTLIMASFGPFSGSAPAELREAAARLSGAKGGGS